MTKLQIQIPVNYKSRYIKIQSISITNSDTSYPETSTSSQYQYQLQIQIFNNSRFLDTSSNIISNILLSLTNRYNEYGNYGTCKPLEPANFEFNWCFMSYSSSYNSLSFQTMEPANQILKHYTQYFKPVVWITNIDSQVRLTVQNGSKNAVLMTNQWTMMDFNFQNTFEPLAAHFLIVLTSLCTFTGQRSF